MARFKTRPNPRTRLAKQLKSNTKKNTQTASRPSGGTTKHDRVHLDGKLYLEHTLAQPVSGRIGLWSKADSHMYFADYTVTTTN